MIPIAISCMPPRSSTAITVVVTPGTNSPAILNAIATGMPRNARPAKKKPSRVASCSGTYENEAIASNEKRSILRNENFVSPAWRASRLYGTLVCVKPTHAVIPRM